MKQIKHFGILFLIAACNSSQDNQAENAALPEKTIDTSSVVAATADTNITNFQKTLNLQGISFTITTKPASEKTILTIQPEGLQISNDPIEEQITGIVTGAEIEDLNKDGYPELLVYTQTTDPGKKGSVVAVSVNGGKSASSVYFPEIMEDPKLANGYQGQDEFQLAEDVLVRRFPIYADGKASGKSREIQYRLKEGEASRKLTPVKSSVY